MTDYILREDAGAVATLTLNHPAKLNCLSEGMMQALQGALDSIAGDPSVRIVVLRGAGKAFCAGHDLAEMTQARQGADGGLAYFKALFVQCSGLMQSVRNLPQPVIAQVHGVAAAAGCQLVATCDMAVAEETCRFGVNGVNIGLFCSTPMVALTRNIHRKAAFEMLTTGELIPADKAQALGLVNRIAPAGRGGEVTAELAAHCAGKLGEALRIGKQAFYRQAEMGLEEAYAYAGEVMAENMMLKQTQKGIEAFLEKRQPEWDQD
ncbi:enoyl-CoA hydratase [Alphaproteobacteria bacterium KMM 3653]|uniref:Enoyl-CoA hydratase domain-containing protein 3, mitochondrial n=1 Tax=Harenicola maris TaxID=2841044 RepID=A0AAP2CN81_9RHOB|nr:enoyl-CoA hydratase [Harenicola maris]